MSDVSTVAAGSSFLKTIDPGTPRLLPDRSSSVMLFSRKATSGMPQKSVIIACSRTTLARWSAASPVILLKLTLHISRVHTHSANTHSTEMGSRRHQGCHRNSVRFLVSGR